MGDELNPINTLSVSDRKAEIASYISAIATSMLLIVLAGIWSDINDGKKLIAQAVTEIAVISSENTHRDADTVKLKKITSRNRSDIIIIKSHLSIPDQAPSD